jgi:hypothetical protein
LGFAVFRALAVMENDNDNEKPTKQNGDGREVKEPPKKNEGLIVDFELPPKEPNKKSEAE